MRMVLNRQNDGAKFKVKTVHGPQKVIVIRERFIKFIARIGRIVRRRCASSLTYTNTHITDHRIRFRKRGWV